MSKIILKVFSNADDVHLVWTYDDDIPGCLGFASNADEAMRNRNIFRTASGLRTTLRSTPTGSGILRDPRSFGRFSATIGLITRRILGM